MYHALVINLDPFMYKFHFLHVMWNKHFNGFTLLDFVFFFCLIHYKIEQCEYLFLAHLTKGHVSFCYHLASVIHRTWSTFTFKSSHLKTLNQIKANMAGMVLGWIPFKVLSNSLALHSRWLLLLKIEISWIVHWHCCFIINQNEHKF